jgi:hypothetical protein
MTSRAHAVLSGDSLSFCLLPGAASKLPTGPVVFVSRAREDLRALVVPTVIVADVSECHRERNRAEV